MLNSMQNALSQVEEEQRVVRNDLMQAYQREIDDACKKISQAKRSGTCTKVTFSIGPDRNREGQWLYDALKELGHRCLERKSIRDELIDGSNTQFFTFEVEVRTSH